MSRFNDYFVCLVLVATGVGPVYAAEDARAAIDSARSQFKQAVELQGGWVTTEALLESAEKLYASGDANTALQLAALAKREAQISYEQAVREKDHWSEPPYLRKP